MKKFYTLIMAVILTGANAFESKACDQSSFTLNSHVDLGGGLHEYTVTFCTGSGPGGADQATYLWAVSLDGGAAFSSYPATLTSPLTQAVYGANPYGNDMLLYEAVSWPSNSPYMYPDAWACTWGNCGPAASTCITFTFVTVGEPTRLTLGGAEAAGIVVPPYGCNGQPDMAINLGGLTVEAGNTAEFCLGGCTTFNAAVSGGTAPYTYSWYSMFSSTDVGTAANLTVCPTENQLYRVTVTDANGQTSIDYVSVTVFQPPLASAGADQTKYIGYGPTSVTLTGYANNSMGPYTYAWSNGATTKNIIVSPTVTTNYTLTVTDARGCTQQDVVTVNVRDIRCGSNKVYMCRSNGTTTNCVQKSQVPSKLNQGWTLGACGSFKLDGSEEEDVSITDEETVIGTNVFPNPAADNVTVQYGFDADVTVNIEVYDMSGRVVQTVARNSPSIEGELNSTSFSVSDYRSGLYLIAITSSNGDSETHRLMVGH